MNLNHLSLSNFRLFKDLKLAFNPGFNLITGPNGAGKTSILEAIAMLGTGRSFRTRHPRQLLRYQQDKFVIHAEIKPDNAAARKVGLQWQEANGFTSSVAGDHKHSLVDLAKLIPIQLINHYSFQLLEAGPSFRREFIDWAAFYLHPEFMQIWKRFQLALKQRNAALKTGSDIYQVWDKELIETAMQIDSIRQELLTPLFAELQSFWEQYGCLGSLDLEYKPGWNQEVSFEAALNRSRVADQREGITKVGPHRANINVKVAGVDANALLSRGQKKLLFCLLQFARSELLQKYTQRKNIYLVDDLTAELDYESRKKVIKCLEESDCQVILTALEPDSLEGLIDAASINMLPLMETAAA